MKARLLLPILFGTLFAFPANAGTYSYLDPGYVQAVYAVSAAPLTSFTFAPNGDIWAVQSSPGALIRFDSHSTQSVHGTQVHPISQSAPTAGFWGVTSHPDGRLYLASNNSLGIADMSTGSLLATDDLCSGLQLGGLQLAACPVPPYHLGLVGNMSFLDFDPVSGSCVLIGSGTNSDVSFDVNGDAAVFHSYTGALCCPPRLYTVNTLTGMGPNFQFLGFGMSMDISSMATGVAFLDGMHRVIAVLENGSLLDVDLPAKTQMVFASGGFPNAYGTPGGLIRKGPDGALYVLQAGTHYDDGTVTSDFSIVRISQKVVATESTTWGRLKAAYR